MFVWGKTSFAEPDSEKPECHNFMTPQDLQWSRGIRIIDVAMGENHTLLLTNENKIYTCGVNQGGQLGHYLTGKVPHVIESLSAIAMTAVACGKSHSLALSEWGLVYSWGSNTYGQLGSYKENGMQNVPKIVKGLTKYPIVQIACGSNHSMALSNCGHIFTWGNNEYGQLGSKDVESTEPEIRKVDLLVGVPIASISAGGNSSFAISKFGAVYAWGDNSCGQLGTGDNINQATPVQIKLLRSINVRHIKAGDDFSIFLTVNGRVFSCGSGESGQIGHGNIKKQMYPKQILELMGSTVTQVACGCQHVLAFVPSSGRVYSFGNGQFGQLGLGNRNKYDVPQIIPCRWDRPESINKYRVHKIFAAYNRSLVLLSYDTGPPADYRFYDKSSQILEVDYKSLNRSDESPVDQDFFTYVETVFGSLSCLNGSFLCKDIHNFGFPNYHGVEIEYVQRCFSLIAKFETESIKDVIFRGLTDTVLKQIHRFPLDAECMRIYIILPLYHEFNNVRHHKVLHTPFAEAVLNLSFYHKEILSLWWKTMSSDYFESLVNTFKSVVLYLLMSPNITIVKGIIYHHSLETGLSMLAYLNKINVTSNNFKVPYNVFQIPEITECMDIAADYRRWLKSTNDPRGIYLCNYPFIFDAQAKTILLQTDQGFQMHNAMQSAAERAIAAMVSPSEEFISQYLILVIHRNHIVEDTLNQLSRMRNTDFKKPLRVIFVGEEAVDEGGVRKEFFLLVLREALDPNYAMFIEYEETRNLWFSDASFESRNVYYLIGIIFGLAIYNFTIINISFPLALYKKLLDEPVDLIDVKSLSPTMYNSFISLLEYKGSDLTDVFNLNFEVNRCRYGLTTNVELIPNGSSIAVTQENKKEYVDKYVDYIFNVSIQEQYNQFRTGFMKVCGGRVLKLFHSTELMALVVGNENYDWETWEEHTIYKNGYSSGSKVIRWFWKVFHELSLDDKKKFLLFLTGSDRIPISGMKSIRFIIQKTSDGRFLPVAHTCFNLLDLPEYESEEVLRKKLTLAIQQTEGFALV